MRPDCQLLSCDSNGHEGGSDSNGQILLKKSDSNGQILIKSDSKVHNKIIDSDSNGINEINFDHITNKVSDSRKVYCGQTVVVKDSNINRKKNDEKAPILTKQGQSLLSGEMEIISKDISLVTQTVQLAMIK